MKKKKIIAALGLFIGLGAGVSAAHAFPLYQFWNGRGQQFVTTDYNEGQRAGFGYKGIAWNSAPYTGNSVLLYRCVIPSGGGTHHFASRDPGCEGQRTEGNYGYISLIPQPGLVPLYRHYINSNWLGYNAHLITTAPVQYAEPGYVSEGILGYVYPGNTQGF